MTDPRIETAARELKRLFSDGETSDDVMWLSCAKCVLDAADAAAWSEDYPTEDGSYFLAYNRGEYQIARYDANCGIPLDVHGEPVLFTHWQPLPKPPETP